MRRFAPPARATAAILGLLLAVACRPLRPAVPERTALPPVAAVATVGMTVADLARSVDFYTRVLGFTLRSEVVAAGTDVERLDGVPGARKRVTRLALGAETIELSEYVTPRGRPIPADAWSNDRTFQHVAIVTSDMRRADRRLRGARVRPVSAGPQRLPDWNPNAGGIEAFYFEDPDGHVLEAIHFPPGKGDVRWHCARADRPARRHERAVGGASGTPEPCPLFQGIDHTAIVVGDTARSLAFYRDLLGLRIAGTSENWGIEQARLNGVVGAHLRITGLRAAAGPGIELLEYLAPRDGRDAPADLAANDLAHWETTLVTADLAATAQGLAAAGVAFVSPPAVPFAGAPLGFSAATMVRDPDGHALRFTTR